MTAPSTSEAGLSSSIERLLDAMDRLPSQGNVALRVLWLADDPTTTLAELVTAVSSDPVLVARLLHLANSAYYSPRSPIGDVERAIVLLGYATVRTVATVVACGLGGAGLVPEAFWTHAAAVANAAQLIAWRFGVPTGDAFTVGLLHDLGRGLFYVADPQRAAEIDAAVTRREALPPGVEPGAEPGAGPGDLPGRLELERAAFGLTHADAAARVLSSWRFPPAMVDAVAHHHDAPDSARTDLTRLLLAAEAVAERAVGGWDEPVDVEGGLELTGLEPERLETVVTRVRAESGTLAAVLGR